MKLDHEYVFAPKKFEMVPDDSLKVNKFENVALPKI